MSDLVETSIENGLAQLTLARPESGNAMSWQLVDEFARACVEVADDPRVRAVLITAKGKNFCVGGDITAFASEPDPSGYIERLAVRLHGGIARLAAIDAPLVVAVQGAAAGAGLSLAASGDIVIAGEGASFTLAYTALGLTSDGGATWLLPRLIGLRRTQDMMFLNRKIDARLAEQWGLVTQVVADEALGAHALAIATRLAQGPTLAFGRAKRLLHTSYGASLPAQLDAEARAIGETMQTADATDAVKAFIARKKPVFTGK